MKLQMKTVVWRALLSVGFLAVFGGIAMSFAGVGDSRRYREAFLSTPRPDVPVIPVDFHPSRAVAGNCVDCHFLIERPGFESEKQPYRTHPKLPLFVGASSPHPVTSQSCVSCHGGSPHAVRHEGMRPAAMSEASCRSCHRDTPLIPGAERWDAGMLVLRATGCHACHGQTPWEGMRKPGPSLTRVATKLSRDWVTAWLKDPRAITAHARMPKPEFQDDAELASVVEYLFTSAERAPTEAAPPPGNVERGKELVKNLGCLGCHGIDDFPVAGSRYRSAPDLSAVGAKVSLGWLAAWLRKPTHVDPSTTMPDFRLSDSERNDIVAYLATKKGTAPAPAKTAAGGDRDAGKQAITRLGCYGCHEIRGFENLALPGNELPRLTDRFTAEQIDRKHRDLFSYRFDAAEAELLAPALHSLTVPTVKAPSEGLTVLRRYDCQACHSLESLAVAGGEEDEKWRLLVEARVLAHFSDDESLGPPPLVSEGARVHGDWARTFLKTPGAHPLRPALKARMPTFPLTAQESDEIIAYWRSKAFPEKAPPPLDDKRRAAAEALIGRLQCLTCHTREPLPVGTPVEGSRGLAPAFSQMPGRLRREWVIRFLKSPAKLVPGTRMVGFWPGGGFNPAKDILGGDDDAQIEAITDYLLAPRAPSKSPSH